MVYYSSESYSIEYTQVNEENASIHEKIFAFSIFSIMIIRNNT